MDLQDLEYIISTLMLLGSKGTTVTQASFLELFDGDQEKIDQIDPMIAKKLGFEACYPVSGQPYSRKVDTRVLNVLAGIAACTHKFSNDIRLLQHLKEVEEPFEKTQIGSSAMAYKRNPMRSERIASLSRYVMIDALNPAITSATQWFERTLDDSANKRLSVPEGFLAIDGILDLCLNVVDGLVVYPKVIEKRLMSELPFMATENIMMDAVKAGGDRQELHERIRELSMEAGRNVKEKGLDNNLLDLIAADPAFGLNEEELKTFLTEKKIECVVDATHPFAKIVTENIVNACKETQTGYIRCLRETETSGEDLAGQEQVRVFESVRAAAEFLRTTEGNILITTGSKELKEYTKIGNYLERCFARVLSTKAAVEESVRLGCEGKHLIAMQGPFSEEMNLALLHQTRARYFVTKESGKAGGFEEKLKAAKNAGAVLIVIGRPQEIGRSVQEVCHFIESSFVKKEQE